MYMPIPYPDDHVVHYLTTEEEVNKALAHIREGAIGFDTEHVSRKPTEEESFIEEIFNNVPGNKRSGTIVWQAIQKKYGMGFQIEWDNIGLCIVQIARGNDVWLLNMNRIKAFPEELRRIMLAPEIPKAGVGVPADLTVLWNDLGSDMNNVVDCGLMAKLLFAEKYKETLITNLSLQQSAEDILNLTITKEMQKTNWKGDDNGDITDEQKKYAAIDAHASLRLYEALVPALADLATRVNCKIPSACLLAPCTTLPPRTAAAPSPHRPVPTTAQGPYAANPNPNPLLSTRIPPPPESIPAPARARENGDGGDEDEDSP
ncbi:ribonuclease H-like domain-containing protein [Mycena leptocephala]|nr:ribonuclease H-like domain-containing protein [Mycena leptocephala]